MGKRESEVRARMAATPEEGLALFLSAPVMDSILSVTGGGRDNIQATIRPQTTLRGTFSPNSREIALAKDLNFSPDANSPQFPGAGALTIMHEKFHETFQRNLDDPTADPEYNNLYQTLLGKVRNVPLGVLEAKTHRQTNVIDKTRTLDSLTGQFDIERVLQNQTNEYMAYLGALAFHNFRRFEGNVGMTLHSASLIEDKYPGAFDIAKYVTSGLTKTGK